jgi:hypothetical protein
MVDKVNKDGNSSLLYNLNNIDKVQLLHGDIDMLKGLHYSILHRLEIL